MLKKVVLEFLLGYRIISPDEDYLTEAIRILFKAGIPFRVRAGKIHLSYSVFKRAWGILDIQRIKSLSVFLGVRGFFSRLILKKGVVIGLFSVFLLTLLSSNTVFDIRVSGVENISEDTVLSALSDNGLSIGASWLLLDTERVESDVLARTDNIAWININRRGSVAYVEVREKEVKEEPKYTYSSIVAKYDCVIEDITVLSGYAMVSVGDTVKRGDVLISGVPNEEGGDFVCAEGRVKGRVNDRIFVAEDRITIKTTEKEAGAIGFSIKIFKKQINIFKIYGNSTDEYDIIENEYEYKLLGKRIPLSLITHSKTDYIKTKVSMTDEELIFTVREKTAEEILSLTEGSDLLSLKSDGRFTDNGYILYTDVVFLTDVCEVVPFEVK